MFSRPAAWLALVIFAAAAWLVTPYSPQPRTALVPGATQLDAMLTTMLISDGIDRLTTAPLTYYDTSILFPDHEQRRGLEPFLGFPLAGIPLRTLLHLDDVRIFETLRILVTFVICVYGFALLRMLGASVPLAIAGAVMCGTQALILHGVERLQVMSIPLVLPIAYHLLSLWSAVGANRRTIIGHGLALAFFIAMYPLWGLINATILAAAALLLLPLLVRMALRLIEEGRAAKILLPVTAGAAVAGAVLLPWASARADLATYSTPDFLAIKHWNGLELPATWPLVPEFISYRFGLALTLSIAIGAVLLAVSIVRDRGSVRERSRWYLWIVPAAAIVGGWPFQAACLLALAMFWLAQLRMPLGTDTADIRRFTMLAAAGLGVLLWVLSFGPTYVSNQNPHATLFGRMIVGLLPPIASIREFERIAAFGTLFFTIFTVTYISTRSRYRLVEVSAAVILCGAVLFSIRERPLNITEPMLAQPELVTLATHSSRTGGVYVHPLMRWDAKSCILMMETNRITKRPTVNGCLGLIPPYLPYAAGVLHRFPDDEAMWLLRKWRVESVFDLAVEKSIVPPPSAALGFSNTEGRVWELDPAARLAEHPSASHAGEIDLGTPVQWRQDHDGSWLVSMPAGVAAQTIHIEFAMLRTGFERIPSAIRVARAADQSRVPLNLGGSGEWLESLAADQLLQRQSPVARIRLIAPQRGDLRLILEGSDHAPIERITVK